jgi:sugar-specific transcriptional regulator TrmB
MASLRDLGLSEYESRAFQSLLETGPTTAKELSRSSDVPMGRIYDVLNSLETHDLVRTQTTSRPKKYVAVETETALQRLVSAKQRELEEQAEQYEAVAEELSGQLERGDAGEEPFWTVALGPEDAEDLLVERLTAADRRLRTVASTPSQSLDGDSSRRVMDAFDAALDRGVTISVLMATDLAAAFPPEMKERHRDLIGGREGFECRVSDDVTGTFELIDRAEVCIEVPHPLGGGETFAMIDLSDREFAAGVEAAFEERWAEADPLDW